MSEAEALAKWNDYLYKQALSFYRLHKQYTLSVDDFIQEARIAFLQHIRTHDESMWAACTLTIRGALMECVRRNHHLYVPRKSICDEIRKEVSFISMDNEKRCEWLMGYRDDDYSDIDLRAAIAQLTTEEQQIIRMLLEGWSVTEIADRMGKPHQTISYRLKAIRRKTVA